MKPKKNVAIDDLEKELLTDLKKMRLYEDILLESNDHGSYVTKVNNMSGTK